ncbi:hypothetical protein BDR26DRAFT_876930 [Obelidium mucronatum]|nr:hypothetical protein BDR26DRAFT_876930 [Obelidium mucronatum]
MSDATGLQGFINQQVFVVTYDGRTIMGELKGFDQTCTLILKKAVERIIQKNEVTEEVPLGLYIVRLWLENWISRETMQSTGSKCARIQCIQ